MKLKQKKLILTLSTITFLVIGGITGAIIYFFVPIFQNTQELGQINTGGLAYRLDVEGDFAYVLDNTEGLVIINITDPINPQMLSSSHHSESLSVIDVEEGIGYIVDRYNRLSIINVSDPHNPNLLTVYGNSSSKIIDIQVIGNIAYISEWDLGLITLNISNPSNVTELDRLSTSGGSLYLEVSNDRACLISYSDYYCELAVINVSDPENLSSLGNFTITGVNLSDPVIKGDIVYIGESRSHPEDDSHSCFHIINVSDPENIQKIGEYCKDGIYSFYVKGNHLYSANCDRGLEIYDISDPIDPKKVGRYDDGGAAYDVKVIGNIAYVADSEDGLEIIEILV